MDSILEVVLAPDPHLIRLDAAKTTTEFRLGGTLEEVQRRLERTPRGKPVFVYTQAQDLHISTLNREGKSIPGGGSYPGFYAPYASRLQRLDTQFGAFVQYLKDTGRYDRSIIIFTSDHGDSLGEEGRFGHAYTLFPEILKVPLIIHLPETLKANLVVDPGRPAFLTDITPSLYYLLGHRPLATDPVFGRPLFTHTLAEQAAGHRDHYLLASSYGAVWGILTGDGQGLYISDGVTFTDHAFELGPGPAATRKAVSATTKGRYDALIVSDIKHLNQFYHFGSGS